MAAVWVTKLAAIAMLLSNVEYLARPRTLADEGLLSWRVGRLRSPWLVESVGGRLLNAVLAYPNVLGLIGLRAILSILVLLAPPSLIGSPWLMVPLALVTLAFLLRSNYGLDGADQMAWIIIAGFALASVSPTEEARRACLAFIALQGCLSYLVAGVAKATASKWRNGHYLPGIFRTSIYGHRDFARILEAHPRLAALLARGLIVWECGFSLVLILPVPLVVVIVVAGVLFHLANAYLMGLNAFLWAFIATYPAVLYLVQNRGW